MPPKYQPFPTIALSERQWPNRVRTHAPIWCSVDLRDGNQALPMPMNVSQKLEMFDLLVRCGFREIEVGFPASCATEFTFVRQLIEGGRIPDDVTIQVLVQCREDLIERTLESLQGARRAIVHLYNSTSPAQRRVVFKKEKKEIVQIACQGVEWIKSRLDRLPQTEVVLQYSPESFSGTEVEFALEISESVIEVWGPTSDKKMILNLPETVEVAMPNVYADQIEYIVRHLKHRDCVTVSVHTHNDRGTGVAATELALLAGAERVEGTLFGNGERTGNVDLITVALNMFADGVDPGIKVFDVDGMRRIYERCTGLTVPPRHPYVGELVFTAFSGSHQDAIKKGLAARNDHEVWDVPYLLIDPKDVGRQYQSLIRVNSQSGKGGVAFVLENQCGLKLPKDMQREFGPIANDKVDALAREVNPDELRNMFFAEYVDRTTPWALCEMQCSGEDRSVCDGIVSHNEEKFTIRGEGKGPIAAFVHALQGIDTPRFAVVSYEEHALGTGEDALAIAYIQIRLLEGEAAFWGAGIDSNIQRASLKAILSALNRGITS